MKEGVQYYWYKAAFPKSILALTSLVMCEQIFFGDASGVLFDIQCYCKLYCYMTEKKKSL